MITTLLIITGILILFFIIIASKRKKHQKHNEVDISSFLFPNGEKDIEKGANDLLQILNNNLVSEQMAKSIYLRATCVCYLSTHEGDFTKDDLEGHLSSSMEYFDDTTLTSFHEYLCSNDINKKRSENEKFIKESGLFSTIPLTDEGEITDGYGEFGFEMTNPIPVISISDGYNYLDRLRTDNDRKVTYERIEAVQAPNIDEFIDSYDIFLGSKKIKTIYICPYGEKTSSKAPEGFALDQNT